MITSLSFHSGYPTRLPGIRRRKLHFGDRINVLLGPNGSGKSTILKTLSIATGCGDGGWSDHHKTADLPFRISLAWDSRPVFFHDCHTHSERSFIGADYLESHRLLRSTGEKRIGLINELIDYIEGHFLTYRLKWSERPTLLLDEVDNHVGFAGQAVLWKDIFPRLSKKYQLIISTHSIFPILLRKNDSLRRDTLIELSASYGRQCVRELGAAIGHFNDLVENEAERQSPRQIKSIQATDIKT